MRYDYIAWSAQTITQDTMGDKMTPDQISKAFATTDTLTFSPYFAVQALVGGRVWETFFAPYQTAADAIAMRDHLAEKNPKCRYQAIRVEVV